MRRGWVGLILVSVSLSGAAQAPVPELKHIANCAHTMEYASELALEKGNKSPAVRMAYYAALGSTTWFIRKKLDGTLTKQSSGELVAQGSSNRNFLDANPGMLSLAVERCFDTIAAAASDPRVEKSIMWGKPFQENVEDMMQSMHPKAWWANPN